MNNFYEHINPKRNLYLKGQQESKILLATLKTVENRQGKAVEFLISVKKMFIKSMYMYLPALLSYYDNIMLLSLGHSLCSKLCWHNS